MMKYSLLLLVLMFTACSPAKRLARFHKNHSYLFTNAIDTVVIKDTIRVNIPGTKKDTAVNYRRLIDTVYLQNNYSKTTVYQVKDTVYILNEVDSVSIEVPYEKTIEVPKYNLPDLEQKYPFRSMILFFLLGFMLYVLISIFVRK